MTASLPSLLLVEDNPVDVMLLRGLLKDAARPHPLRVVEMLSEALDALREPDPRVDLVLLDLSLPDMRGLEGLAHVRRVAPDVPVVILTGRADEETALRALQSGAQDYLVKGQTTPDLLRRSIRYSLERSRAQRALLSAGDALSQARRMEAVGRLAGGVAHDFNNILTAVLGSADLALVELGEEHPVRADLEEIRSQASRAAEMTRALLAFSRQDVTQPTVLEIDPAVEALSRRLERLLGDGVELELDLAGDGRAVLVDPARLEQVLVNLVLNARAAMPHGGRLTLTTRCGPGPSTVPDSPEGYVCLTVGDTGHGIEPDVLPHVFEPFFTTNQAGRGTGLGLSTVWGIVQDAGGTVIAESVPGEGSTFSVHLPVHAAPPPDGELDPAGGAGAPADDRSPPELR